VRFSRPAVTAAAAGLFALVLHPAARAESWLPSPPLVTALLALLLLTSLLARAALHPRERVLAAGALLVVGALGYDGARGVRGTVSLGVGDATSTFLEEGLGGRRLGLRPLGFTLGLERLREGGRIEVSVPAGSATRLELAPESALGVGAFRLGAPRAVPTGEVVRLVVAVHGGPQPAQAVVTPTEAGQAEDLKVGLERYFPDFALDERQQPMTRSVEPKNPAALLRVEKAGKVHRVFVLGSMPGLHRVEALDRSFSLVGVDPDVKVDIAVVSEPAAAVGLLGLVLAAAGTLVSRLPREVA
jgi:hypothetical protein